MVAAFNVNKSATGVSGALSAADVEGLAVGAGRRVAVYGRAGGRVALLGAGAEALPLSLGQGGHDFFTLAPVEGGVAVFGLLDKYLGPAAVTSVARSGRRVRVGLEEAGDFGAWLERAPARVEVDGRALPASAYGYANGLLRVPRSSFGERAGAREVVIVLA